MTATTDEVLSFWFGELAPADWFSGDKAVDETIRARFLPACRALLDTRPEAHLGDPRSALAAIIVLDQFTRSVFRRTPEAFAGDAIALAICRGALDRGCDAGMTPAEKMFLHMPLVHSERIEDQERVVALCGAFMDEEGMSHIIEHRDIIARFGRFPHRNRVLGRESTPDEIAFVAGHPGHGQ